MTRLLTAALLSCLLSGAAKKATESDHPAAAQLTKFVGRDALLCVPKRKFICDPTGGCTAEPAGNANLVVLGKLGRYQRCNGDDCGEILPFRYDQSGVFATLTPTDRGGAFIRIIASEKGEDVLYSETVTSGFRQLIYYGTCL